MFDAYAVMHVLFGQGPSLMRVYLAQLFNILCSLCFGVAINNFLLYINRLLFIWSAVTIFSQKNCHRFTYFVVVALHGP